MFSRISYIMLILSLLLSACRVKRKEYIERNGLHSDDKPSVIAKELGAQSKKHQRAYLKQLKRAKKDIAKRNRQAQKNITKAKIKTTKATRKADKSGTPKETLK